MKESILDPKARLVQGYPPVMVTYTLNDDELGALVALIKSLSAGRQDKEPTPGEASNPGDDLAAQGQKVDQRTLSSAADALPNQRARRPSVPESRHA